MSTRHLEQAREIYSTVRLLQDRVIRRDLHRNRHGGEGVCAKDLTVPQWNTLQTIHERGQVTIKSLSEALQVSAPSASSMVERLVEMGMLVRKQSRTDRREVLVRVTKAGQTALEEMDEMILTTVSDLMDKLTETEVEQWCRIYRRLREVVLAESEAARDAAANGLE